MFDDIIERLKADCDWLRQKLDGMRAGDLKFFEGEEDVTAEMFNHDEGMLIRLEELIKAYEARNA